LWLKCSINALFSFGVAKQDFKVQWQIWLHLLLGITVCLSVNVKPYLSAVDQQVELFALMTLAVVTHVASVVKQGTTWDLSSLVLATALAVLPLASVAILKFQEKHSASKQLEVNRQRAEKMKKQLSAATAFEDKPPRAQLIPLGVPRNEEMAPPLPPRILPPVILPALSPTKESVGAASGLPGLPGVPGESRLSPPRVQVFRDDAFTTNTHK